MQHIWSCRTHSGQAWAGVWRRFWSTCWQTCRKQKIQELWKQTHFIIITYYVEVKTPSVSLVCMCVLSGSDCVFLRKRTAFSFSSFRMRRPRFDWIWMENTVSCSVCTFVRVSEFKKLFFFLHTNLFQLLLLQRLGLFCQVFKLILLLQLLLPPLDLCKNSTT